MWVIKSSFHHLKALTLHHFLVSLTWLLPQKLISLNPKFNQRMEAITRWEIIGFEVGPYLVNDHEIGSEQVRGELIGHHSSKANQLFWLASQERGVAKSHLFR